MFVSEAHAHLPVKFVIQCSQNAELLFQFFHMFLDMPACITKTQDNFHSLKEVHQPIEKKHKNIYVEHCIYFLSPARKIISMCACL